MEQSTAHRRGGRKRRGGKRKRSDNCHSENNECKMERPLEKQEEEKEDEKKEIKTPQPWNCPACTYLNEALRCYCEMCETPNPLLLPGLRASTASNWSCAACTVVNPVIMRVCVVCGSLNPRPIPIGDRSVRLPDAFDSDEDESLSSSSNDKEENSQNEEENDSWTCKSCQALSSGHSCLSCSIARPKPAQKLDDAAVEKKLWIAQNNQVPLAAQKHRKRAKKMQEKSKIAYGVSIVELKKLLTEPESSRLNVTLQTLTHTLAMTDASEDNEWADGSSFLIRDFGSGSAHELPKDPELLTVLATIAQNNCTYPVEIRLLALQSINYLMKMDRYMFARAKMLDIVRLYIRNLLAWKDNTAQSFEDAKNLQMIVEECLNGLSSVCSTEAFALRELLVHDNFIGYLDILQCLVDENEKKNGNYHPSIFMTALEILQKCCMKLRWSGKSQHKHQVNDTVRNFKLPWTSSPLTAIQGGNLTLELALKLVAFLLIALQHKHVPLHVKAAKCLLLIFRRTPYDNPEIIEEFVTPDVLRKFVAAIVNDKGAESNESRLAMAKLMLFLFDSHSQLVTVFVREKIYTELLNGILQILQSSSEALRTNTLKLVAMFTRIVCRRHAPGSACCTPDSSSDHTLSFKTTTSLTRKRQPMNSLPDPYVLPTLLLDFIRVDSIAAVDIILKDGADLNFPNMCDLKGNEIDKPLNVAVEFASLRMIRLLLKRGADIHQVGIGGTALHVAARLGRCDVAAILLQCGARVLAKDRQKKTVMDVAKAVDKDASEGSYENSILSPMQKLLELTGGLRDYSSDGSDIDEGKNHSWFYSSDIDDEDEVNDDDVENEGDNYIDYDDNEDFEGSSHCDIELDDSETSSDDDVTFCDTELSSKSVLIKRCSPVSLKSETNCHNVSSVIPRREASLTDQNCPEEGSVLKRRIIDTTADEVYVFSLAITKSLLVVLHDVDIHNVERSILSTVACVLEMVPSQLIMTLNDADVALILDTIHFLLQGEKLSPSCFKAAKSLANAVSPDSMPIDTNKTSAVAESNLPSFILAARILQAMVRKSPKELSIFHQIERRGIVKQIEQLNDASACWISTSYSKANHYGPRDTIFGRTLDLLESLRADILESGMLHLHKLRNLARRLKEVSDQTPLRQRELVLVDLVDLFEDPNSITTYEFKQSELFSAILQYLSPQSELHESRGLALMQAFNCCPAALKHLISRLQSIITEEETFPVISYNTGKGRELYPLTRQLKIAITRPDGSFASNRQHKSPTRRTEGMLIHTSPLAHFQSFERMVFRSMAVIDSSLSLLYHNLVGYSIQKVVEGKWREFLIVGYDDTRSYHLLKPSGGTDEDLAEMVLHDSPCKLNQGVKVYEGVALDLTLFGLPKVDSSGDKKRKNNKRKRRSFTLKRVQADSDILVDVEVKNVGMLKMPSLHGAWYAAVLWNESGEAWKLSDGKLNTCEKILAAEGTHSVKLLAENRIVRKVPADCIRPRAFQPQVGSVVDLVGGTLGEVVHVYENDCLSRTGILLDVKASSNGEIIRVKRDSIRYPPHEASTSALENKKNRIDIQQFLPAHENSLLVGSVGDRVWVKPMSGTPVKNFCVAGTVKNFHSRLGSVAGSHTVVVEVAFGSTQAPLVLKVDQDQVLNFAVGNGVLSGRGSSRLLAALQMASGHRDLNKTFGGGRSVHNINTTAIHRAFGRVAGSLQQNRQESRLGSAGTAMDQIRNLISSNTTIDATNAPSDVEIIEQPPLISESEAGLIASDGLIDSEQAEDEASILLPSRVTDEKVIRQQKSMIKANGNMSVTTCLTHHGLKPKATCSQLPKVNLVIGSRGCDTSIAKYTEFEPKNRKLTSSAPLLIQLDQAIQQNKATAAARMALLEIFSSFEGSVSGASQNKKRKTLPPVTHQKATSIKAAPWDIDKFIAFMQAVYGSSKVSHPGSDAKYCVTFSKFADTDTGRKLLQSDGFVSLIIHECKIATKSKLITQFLQSRGYSAKSLTSGGSREDDGDQKISSDGVFKGDAETKASGSNILRQPVVLHGFSADQNILKCLENLRQEYCARSCTDAAGSDTSAFLPDVHMPPWKLTYKLYCDFQVEWETSDATNASDSDMAPLEPLEILAFKPPTRLLLHGLITLNDMHASGLAEANRWLTWITASQASSGARDKVVVSNSVARALRLLLYLFQSRVDSASLNEALWTSPRLYNKLDTQMQDVLSMCSGIYPSWCDSLVTHCKFLFPRDLREKLFRSTSFGCTRSLHWFRTQMNIDDSSSDSIGGVGIFNQEITITPIPKERVKVYRANILESAEVVMKLHAKRKAILDVVFVGEKGYGSGVTAAFYSTTAHALHTLSENQTKHYWIFGEDDEARAADAKTFCSDGFNEIAEEAAVIRHSNGLFPYPHRKPDSKLVNRFRLVGRLAGKALMDERLLPLPLSPQFMKLVVGESFGLNELEDIFLSHGRIVYSMYKASKQLTAGKENVQIEDLVVEDWLDAVGLTFIDPLSQEPLVAGGDEIAVSSSNLALFVRAVLELWLDLGIRAQVLAFREGINEVLPVKKLRLLFVSELLSLLCGEQDIQWNAQSLLKDTKLAHGYTKDSQPVQYFFEVLEEMSVAERRAFLLYATGCPNLPPGGFKALKPPFEVVRRVVDNLDVDRALPFARTCTNTLHLPAYSSKNVLAKQMMFAIANSRGVIDRD